MLGLGGRLAAIEPAGGGAAVPAAAGKLLTGGGAMIDGAAIGRPGSELKYKK